ncbi:fibroblast growth factor receptor-like 1 isoform X2 [Tigriopus californicus]|nr:fibroblast growth factor receptor-like 1 isoform X2 [Tigriopus californicus]
MIQWSKNGEQIDFHWERHKSKKNILKIKHVTEDDTGIFMCKAINGFGSIQVRVELIVIEPSGIPSSLENAGVAAPVFTQETKMAKQHQALSVGDSFKVGCEALGSPEPNIFWFKDGQRITESVQYHQGRSILEFSILGTADSGVYTCHAQNVIGDRTKNFTLGVKQTVGTTHAIVTEVGPTNTTVIAGGSTTLQCKVKSLDRPHVKWLKRLEYHEQEASNTLKVGNERYRILDSTEDILTGNDEYLNNLILPQLEEDDSGMYICFVTNSGFGNLTYKSMNLKVLPKSSVTTPHEPKASSSDPILVVVICLSAAVLSLLVMIIVCVLRKPVNRRGNGGNGVDNASSESGEVQKPFMKSCVIAHKPLPVPPTQTGSGSRFGPWSRTIYPEYEQKLTGKDSGFNTSLCTPSDPSPRDLESPNTYEVPFSHRVNSRPRSENPYVFQSGQYLRPPSSRSQRSDPNWPMRNNYPFGNTLAPSNLRGSQFFYNDFDDHHRFVPQN